MIEIKKGATITTLCGSGSGFWNRESDSRSIGPISTKERGVFRRGSRIVEVASPYSVAGDISEATLWTSAFFRKESAACCMSAVCVIGATASASRLPPSPTKKERPIQTARDARAEVAVLRKTTEKRIAAPSQNEI